MNSESSGVCFTPITSLLCKVVDNRGRTCPTTDEGIPLIATNCIGNDNLYPVKKNIRYVSPETYNSWFRGHPQPGDVIFVNKGTPGRVCLVPDPVDFCIAQDMVALRPNQKVNNLYLLAALRAPVVQRQIKEMQVGTTIPHFKKGDFEKLLVPMHDLPTQAAIGRLYVELSRKILVNEQVFETLERIAQSVFQSWFIDFDPVRAKMASEAPVRMDAQTAELFPDSMEDSELGEIPSGWRVSNVGSSVQLAGGATPSTKNPEFWDGEYSWLTPKDLSGRRQKIAPPPSRKITLRGLERISSGLLEKGTVLLSSRAPIGYTAICAKETAVNQGFIALKADELFPPMYLLNWVESNMQEILNRAGGATFAEVSKAAFRDIPFLCPDAGVLHRYREVTAPIVSQLEVLETENRLLAELRDTLLPRLISGELEIPDEMLAA